MCFLVFLPSVFHKEFQGVHGNASFFPKQLNIEIKTGRTARPSNEGSTFLVANSVKEVIHQWQILFHQPSSATWSGGSSGHPARHFLDGFAPSQSHSWEHRGLGKQEEWLYLIPEATLKSLLTSAFTKYREPICDSWMPLWRWVLVTVFCKAVAVMHKYTELLLSVNVVQKSWFSPCEGESACSPGTT